MISTDNEKLAIMEFGQVFEPGLPLLPGAIDTADQQQFLHGYPGIAWGSEVIAAAISVAGPIARKIAFSIASAITQVRY